jgi:hypothetical protein
MLWQYIWSAVTHLLNMIVIGGLSWHAFRQSERIKSLIDQVIGLEVENDRIKQARNRCGTCNRYLHNIELCNECHEQMLDETSP